MKAVKIAPEDCGIQNDTGVVFDFNLKQPDKAEPYYRKAVQIGNALGYDCTSGAMPDMGFRDGVNNLARLLLTQKRWKDLKEFAENDVPAAHPMRDIWIRQAEEAK